MCIEFQMQKYVTEVESEILGNKDVSLTPLLESIEELRKAAAKINAKREVLLLELIHIMMLHR